MTRPNVTPLPKQAGTTRKRAPRVAECFIHMARHEAKTDVTAEPAVTQNTRARALPGASGVPMKGFGVGIITRTRDDQHTPLHSAHTA